MANVYQNPWIPDAQEQKDRDEEMAEIAKENRRFQIEESRTWDTDEDRARLDRMIKGEKT